MMASRKRLDRSLDTRTVPSSNPPKRVIATTSRLLQTGFAATAALIMAGCDNPPISSTVPPPTFSATMTDGSMPDAGVVPNPKLPDAGQSLSATVLASAAPTVIADAGVDAAEANSEKITLQSIGGNNARLAQYIAERRKEKGINAFPLRQGEMVHPKPWGVRAAVLGQFGTGETPEEMWIPLCKKVDDATSENPETCSPSNRSDSRWNPSLAIFSFLTPKNTDGNLRFLDEKELFKLFHVTLDKVIDSHTHEAEKIPLFELKDGTVIISPRVEALVKEQYGVDVKIAYTFEQSSSDTGERKPSVVFINVSFSNGKKFIKEGDNKDVKKGTLVIIPSFLAVGGIAKEAGNIAIARTIF